ncbi:hypothetical protein [Roseateles sp.]|jgi:hypothetical protein|uniref:hypothetical protein n=1 Tax=Roseateles sp. TaxID=1971397 RepID=UPI003BA913F6
MGGMQRVILVLGAAAIASELASCSKTENGAPQAAVASDPVAALKAVMAKAKASVDAEPDWTVPPGGFQTKWSRSKATLAETYAMDVQKTQSLVSPYVGSVEFSCNERLNEAESEGDAKSQPLTIENSYACRAALAHQDGKWVFKEMKCAGGTPAADWIFIPSGDGGAHGRCRRAIESATQLVRLG